MTAKAHLGDARINSIYHVNAPKLNNELSKHFS